MREQVLLRDSHCVFPGCRRDSRACDLDHITPYIPIDEGGPPGQTNPLKSRAPVPDPPPDQDPHRLGLQTPRPGRRHLRLDRTRPATSTRSHPSHAAPHREEPDAPPPRPTPAGATGTPTGPIGGFDKLNQRWPRPAVRLTDVVSTDHSLRSLLDHPQAATERTLRPQPPQPQRSRGTSASRTKASGTPAQPDSGRRPPLSTEARQGPCWFRQAQPAVDTAFIRLTEWFRQAQPAVRTAAVRLAQAAVTGPPSLPRPPPPITEARRRTHPGFDKLNQRWPRPRPCPASGQVAGGGSSASAISSAEASAGTMTSPGSSSEASSGGSPTAV